MSSDVERALAAALDERDRLLHELGQVVRDLAGHSDPEVSSVQRRAAAVLAEIQPED